MDKIALLCGDSSKDDQVLETDIMRFMAIIGIIFWIIFSMIKSIPFKAAETFPEKKSVSIQIPEPSNLQKQKTVIKIEKKPEPRIESGSEPRIESVPEAETFAQTKTDKSPMQKGIFMQFQSRRDLLLLMAKGKTRIFCRAQAKGFDIFFEGFPMKDSVVFKGVSNIPASLWEIKTGKERDYFIDIISRSFPALRSFTDRRVMVSFTDQELENRVISELSRLQKELRNGILSINAGGEVIFSGLETKRDAEKTIVEGGK
jgi:hypothetical protein